MIILIWLLGSNLSREYTNTTVNSTQDDWLLHIQAAYQYQLNYISTNT